MSRIAMPSRKSFSKNRLRPSRIQIPRLTADFGAWTDFKIQLSPCRIQITRLALREEKKREGGREEKKRKKKRIEEKAESIEEKADTIRGGNDRNRSAYSKKDILQKNGYT
jgi:hypothetical protein